MERLSFFPAVKPDGDFTLIQHKPGESQYEEFIEFLGGGFLDLAKIGHDEETGEVIGVMLRDNGLFDGSQPNLPVMAGLAFPLCGPVIFTGGADSKGETLPPLDHPAIRTVMAAAMNIKTAIDQISHNRDNPFTITVMDEQGANNDNDD